VSSGALKERMRKNHGSSGNRGENMKRAGMEKRCIRAVWILAETADPC